MIIDNLDYIHSLLNQHNQIATSALTATRQVAEAVEAGTAATFAHGQMVADSSRENAARIVGAISDIESAIDKMSGVFGNKLQQLGNMIDHSFSMLNDQMRIQNLLSQNLAELLKVPDFQKERQYYIEQGFKHYRNARFDPSLFADALRNLLQAEAREGSDYIVLHRIGMIYLYSKDDRDYPLAEAYFRKAAKYAAVESNMDAERILNVLTAEPTSDLSNSDAPRSARLLAAESYLQASIACMEQGKFNISTELAQKSLGKH